jgi:hypothetical protein
MENHTPQMLINRIIAGIQSSAKEFKVTNMAIPGIGWILINGQFTVAGIKWLSKSNIKP